MQVTGIVLAGGMGRRMGGVDKGLVPFQGRPMVATVIERFRPQVDEMLINANRHEDAYAGYGYRVIPDATTGFAGPLAGFQAGLMAASHEWVATVPCDTPFLPQDLIARLKSALASEDAQLAVAVAGDRPQPVFCLCRRDVLSHLTGFLQQGGRKVDAWHATLKVVEVSFDDEADAFFNINTLQDLEAAR